MFIKATDICYHVNVIGQGEPLLLLHGFTGSQNTWVPFVEGWSQAYKLILVDLIGHGKTDHPDHFDRYSTENVVDDLKAILHELGIPKTHVLGYSMGGRVALSLAILAPELVLTLILESSSPGLELAEERHTRRNNDNLLADQIEQDGIEKFVEYWEDIPLFSTQKDKVSAAKQQAIRAERLRNSSIGLANSLRGMGTGVQPSWWKRLSAVNRPTLLVAGELDQKFCKINEEMHKRLPNSKILIINNAGHAIHVEQPEFFGKIVRDYLAGEIHY